jgi:hypothetical protein
MTMARRRSRLDLRAMGELARLADYTIAFVIRAVCRLGVADHLSEAPCPAAELAAACGADEASLLRALRALVTREIFAEPAPGQFTLTPLGVLLRSDHPRSLRWAFPTDEEIDALAQLAGCVRTGRAAHAPNPANAGSAAQQQTARRAWAPFEAAAIVAGCDWSALRSVADLGDDDGTLMRQLLVRHRNLRALPLDQQRLPSADAYLLNRRIAALEDEPALSLLRSVRAAMPAHGRVLVVEPIAAASDVGTAVDVAMLAAGSGRARTLSELARLLGAADLNIVRCMADRDTPFLEAAAAA